MTREIGPELIARIRHVADSLEAIARGEVDSVPGSYEKSDENRTNTNTNRDTTPREGSVQGEGAVGMADIAYEAAENLQGVCKTFDQWSRETAGVMHRLARHIEMLESRVPSDAEREAISLAYSRLTADAKYEEVAATLKAFLARMRK